MNAQDKNDDTALHLAATLGKLLTHLNDVFWFFTGLFHTLSGHKNVVQALIELGANVFVENSKNQTPRQIARLNGEIPHFCPKLY